MQEPNRPPPRRPRYWTVGLSLVMVLQVATIGALWGQDPWLVNTWLPRYQAWQQAREEMRRARHRLPLGQPLPPLQARAVAGERAQLWQGRETVLLFIGQCHG
ncbi:MAG: hypothetical protein NZT92_15375 [Abditibacteriales bacterium]|nr:hypothetical protein [Abditibacteriales bacterium]MDW8367325.1 hypothetical protein [Abditibacteriales bacterium]